MTNDTDSIRVLLVDADSDFAASTAADIEREFELITVETAESATKGLEYLTDGNFSCVVSAYDLPERDGLTFLESVKEQSPAVPVVLLDGETGGMATEAFSAGVDAYVQAGASEVVAVLGNRIETEVENYRTKWDVDHTENRLSQVPDDLDRRERDRRFKAIFNNIYTFVGLLEPDGTLVEANQTALSFGGLTHEEVVGKPLWETPWFTADEDSREAAREGVEQARNGDLFREEVRVQGEHEESIIDFSIRPVQDDHGEVTALVPEGRDITGRKQRTRRLETLINNLPGMVYRCRNETGWPMQNVRGRVEELTGYQPSEMEARNGLYGTEIIHEDDREKVWEEVQAALDAREPFELTYRIVTGAGETKWVWERGEGVYSHEGGVAALEGFITDITARKEREEELTRTNTILSTLLENMPPGVMVEDGDRQIVAVNQACCELLGLETECGQLEGQDCRETAEAVKDHFEDPAGFVDRIDTLIEERERVLAEEIRTADGRILSRSYVPFSLPDGEGNLWLYRDITERKGRERALSELHRAANDLGSAESEEMVYDILVEAAEQILDFALVAVDIEEDGALVQKAWTLDQDSEGYYSETPLDQDTLATRAYRRGETIVADDLREYDIIPADPDYLSALTVPIGDIGTFQTVSREVGGFDEADRELAELLVGHAHAALQRLSYTRSLQEQREQLRRENERLEQFASVVSHDLRNPLNVAEGRLELALEECESEHLGDVERALDRMGALIEDILMLATEGDRVSDVERVPLEEVVDTCWQNVETGGAELRVETEAVVMADRSRLQQLLANLVSNAIDHGGPDVTVTVGALSEGFYVADDGSGIDSAEVETIFESGYSTTEEGTGFGLSIVNEIVKAHGWQVDVMESESGGARFEITGVDLAT